MTTPDTEIQKLLKEAEAGDPAAQFSLGVSYSTGDGIDKDEKVASEWYRRAAEQGYVVAQFNLGLMYEHGQGVAKSEETACEWYRRAAKLGYTAASYNLGLIYANGQGNVSKDEKLACAWYRKAAEQGYVYAQYNLGLMYENGRGVAKDEKAAFEWYQKAAEQGDAEGQYNLGVMYVTGRGVTKSEEAASEWYRKAAEQGYLAAQFNLGLLYATGQGVPKDEKVASEWYQLAADQGDDNAKQQLEFLMAREEGVESSSSSAYASDPAAIASDRAALEIEEKHAKELQAETKSTREKFWEFNVSLQPSGPMKESYVLIPAGKDEIEKVLGVYHLTGIPNYEIGDVQIIYNPSLTRAFVSRLELLKERVGSPIFKPKWDQENDPTWRGKIISLLEKMSAAYADPDFPGVNIIPCWHATDSSVLQSLFKTGFANLATTDKGWYGKGIYGSLEIEYPFRVFNNGALLFNIFSCFSAYPVIHGDMEKLIGRANYKNYDAHIVPVKAEFPRDPDPVSYIPTKPGEMPTYTEFVVFESSQALPWALIKLQPTLVAAPSSKPLIYAFMAEMQKGVAAKPTKPKRKKKKGKGKP